MKIKHVTIVGMGALGIMYGSHIAQHGEMENLSFLMDEKRYEKYKDQSVTCNGIPMKFHCITPAQAEPADLLIVAVKYTGLAGAIEMMKPAIGPNTIILSVMNGISSEEILEEHFGHSHRIDTVALGMDAMKFGADLTYTKMGLLAIGVSDPELWGNVKAVQEYFERIEMPHRVEADIRHAVWSKFMLNVGVNQTCMVYPCTYSDVWNDGPQRTTFLDAMREVIRVGNAEGVALSEKDLEFYDGVIHTLRPDGTPSMGQDRIAGKASEVEAFAGTVIRLGKKHQIPTPVNQWLYDRVQEIEQEYVPRSAH